MASGRIKGITIDIDGNTTKLSESLKKVDSSLRETQNQLKDVNRLLKLDPKNVELLRQKQNLLNKAVEETGKREEQLKKALEQLEKAGDTEENQKQQDALKREIVATQQQTEKLNKELEQFADVAEQSTPKLEKLASGAQKVQEKTQALSAVAAAGAAGMVAMAANAASSADDLLTMSNVTGFSVEELQKLKYASEFVDVSMETMTGSIEKLTKNMASGSSAFDELGISVTNSDGSMRDATDVWYEALEALGEIENETERDQISMELFGKSAMEMAGIVDDGGEALRQLGEDAEATGNILSQDAVEDAVAFNDQIDELKGKAEQAFLSAGAALADTLLPALETLVEVVTNVLAWFGNLDGGTQAFILTVLGLVAAISPIAGIIATISTMATTLNVAMLPMIGTIGAIVIAIGAVVAAGVLLYQNWDTIKQKASELWQNVKDKFEAIRSSVSEKINAAKDAVKTAIDKIKGFFNFSWSLPKLKMPHFSITGKFSLTPPSVPKISVDWYAKAMDGGMILNNPTIFGMMNGNLLGAGEAGSEVVVGANSLRNMIQSAVGSQMVNAPISVDVTINGSVDDPEEFARKIGDRIAGQIRRQNGAFI